jgi:hypothetical protein
MDLRKRRFYFGCRCPGDSRERTMKQTLVLFLTTAFLLMTAHRLPAPISEEPPVTPNPKPKRDTRQVSKSKPEAAFKTKANPATLRFTGTWIGTTLNRISNGSSTGSSAYVIKISGDERTVWINWNKSGTNVTGTGLRASCDRFRETLTWSLTQQGSIEKDSLRMNANGTASFVREGSTYTATGTLSRQDFSPAPSVPQTTTLSPQSSGLPTAQPVPGQPGYVFSPFAPDSGYVDVRGFPSGTEVKDPYTNKLFLVP